MKFKIGDIVTNKIGTKYLVTNENAVLEVVASYDRSGIWGPAAEYIKIKVLSHKTKSMAVGYIYDELASDFELVRRRKVNYIWGK